MIGSRFMHAAWRRGIGKFVSIGTVCAYPKCAPVPFSEAHLWDGYPEPSNAPYGLAKKMLLVQGQAYRTQYAFNAIYLLPTNLYGPGDNFDLEDSHVIPALIRKCVEAKLGGKTSISAWGSGTATRDFLYVDDAAEGIVRAAEAYDGPEPMNLSGEGSEISMRELAESICRATGFAGSVVWDRPDRMVSRAGPWMVGERAKCSGSSRASASMTGCGGPSRGTKTMPAPD